MARDAAQGRELSFHKASKRWCKSYILKGNKYVEYFNAGKGPDDEQSYKKALREFKKWWPQIQAEKQAHKTLNRIGKYLSGQSPATKLGRTPREQILRLSDALDNGKMTLDDLGVCRTTPAMSILRKQALRIAALTKVRQEILTVHLKFALITTCCLLG